MMWLWIVVVAFLTVPFGDGRERSLRLGRVRQGYVDSAVVLDLAAASLASGASIPAVLHSLGMALHGTRVHGGSSDPELLIEVSRLLLMGERWQQAWQGVKGFASLNAALRPAWEDGAAPLPLLKRGAESIRLTRQRTAKEAAERLGASLVLPLGLCFLPAFIFLGVVPIVVATARTLF